MNIKAWKEKARKIKQEVFAVYLACRDPRTPWYAKALAAIVAGYAFSPLDLIPDFIPVLGYLDDLILIPLGIALVIRILPADVLQECREKAQAHFKTGKPTNWIAGCVVVAIWIILFAIFLNYL